MKNEKQIKEGDLVSYMMLTCEVVRANVKFFDLKILGFDKVFQGIHISKIN